MLGQHMTTSWSSTQVSLALSSGEAEYYGVVRGTGIGLGQQALGRDAGFDLPLRVWTDSSAAMGTAARQGLGKLRHLECHSLWVQQRLRRREFALKKVDGTENPADLFTKHMDSSAKLLKLVDLYGCEFRDGRPVAAPELKKAQATGASAAHMCLLSSGHGRGRDRLPHLASNEDVERLHPSAVPDPEVLDEEDQTPKEELADPVPALRRRGQQSATGLCGLVEEAPDVPNETARERTSNRYVSAVGECLRVGSAGAQKAIAHTAPPAARSRCHGRGAESDAGWKRHFGGTTPPAVGKPTTSRDRLEEVTTNTAAELVPDRRPYLRAGRQSRQYSAANSGYEQGDVDSVVGSFGCHPPTTRSLAGDVDSAVGSFGLHPPPARSLARDPAVGSFGLPPPTARSPAPGRGAAARAAREGSVSKSSPPHHAHPGGAVGCLDAGQCRVVPNFRVGPGVARRRDPLGGGERAATGWNASVHRIYIYIYIYDYAAACHLGCGSTMFYNTLEVFRAAWATGRLKGRDEKARGHHALLPVAGSLQGIFQQD